MAGADISSELLLHAMKEVLSAVQLEWREAMRAETCYYSDRLCSAPQLQCAITFHLCLCTQEPLEIVPWVVKLQNHPGGCIPQTLLLGKWSYILLTQTVHYAESSFLIVVILLRILLYICAGTLTAWVCTRVLEFTEGAGSQVSSMCRITSLGLILPTGGGCSVWSL